MYVEVRVAVVYAEKSRSPRVFTSQLQIKRSVNFTSNKSIIIIVASDFSDFWHNARRS